MDNTKADYINGLEAESIHILREVAAQFEKPALLYSVGKDSSVLLHLCKKAFFPGKIPFLFIHVDTSFKFPEMYEFRDRLLQDLGVDFVIHRSNKSGTFNPFDFGTERCCRALKTKGLLDALTENRVDAAIGGARRDEERSRAKERVFSFRDSFGQWDPRNQRPELWRLYNGRINAGEHVRVFPLSNWTEILIWLYIKREGIDVVPLYLAAERTVIRRGGILLSPHECVRPTEPVEKVKVRYRSLGCMPCTGAIESDADSVSKIVDELITIQTSERALRVIDHDSEASMEKKKMEGYF